MARLQAKRVIVTGGSTGIGAAIVARFLEEGAAVVTWCRDRGRSEAIKAALPKLADVVLADVADADAVAAASTRSLSVLGGLDVMICNAGISIRHGFTAITPEEFDRVMRVNLYGSFFASHRRQRRCSRRSMAAPFCSPPRPAGSPATAITPTTTPARARSLR